MDLTNVYLTYKSEDEDVMVVGTVDTDRVKDHKNIGDLLSGFVHGNDVDYSNAGWGYVPFDFWFRYYKGAWLDDAPYYWIHDMPDGSLVWE